MAGPKPRAGSYLELELPRRKNSLDIAPNAVLSPITELALNFESSLGRTPKRKLSLSGDDPSTPNAGFQRSLSTVSNESGYCPDSPPGFLFDSPSMEILKANEKRKQRRPPFKRWNSLPVKSGEDPFTANKENIELNFDTGKDSEIKTTEAVCPSEKKEFKFAQPKCPVGGRKSSIYSLPVRSFSEPSPQSKETFVPSSPSECGSQDSGACDFDYKADGDDDGFIDDFFQEQSKEDNGLEMPSGITELVSAPLVSFTIGEEEKADDARKSSKDTPKASGPGYKPRDLFNAGRDRAYTVASESPTKERGTMRQRSKSFALKRPNPPRDPSPNLKKKLRQRCMSLVEGNHHPSLLDMALFQQRPNEVQACPLRRSQSATFEHDLGDMLDASGDKNIVGDFSGPYTLPSIPGQHDDLKCLTPETVARVLNNEFPEVEAHIIDCRYPYEYEAGHIKGARNIYTKEDIYSEFIDKPKRSLTGKKTILIFHCEFSSKRGPDMSRFLRNRDRDIHYHMYPKLFYPELYLIEGGYKAFFGKCKEYCEPQCYLPMLDENYSQDLKRFSKRSKSEGNILTKGFRPGLGYRR
ncbi:hypothetical protein ACROYT_G004690 [Oculina patagonica]